MNKAEKILQQVKDGYNKIAEHFSQTRRHPWQEFNLFLEYIKNGQKVLDLGSGNSRFYGYIKEQGLSVDYYGLDISEKLIAIAKEKYSEVSDKLIVGAISNLPYQNGQFDLVICIATFHHLPNKELRLQTLSEINRVLKPGGYLLMTNWYLWHWPFWKYFFNNFWQKNSVMDFFFPWKSAGGQEQCLRYYHVFTKSELLKLHQKAGFKIIKVFPHLEAQGKKVYKRGVNMASVARK